MKVKIPKEFTIGATGATVGFAKHIHSDEGFNGTYNKRTEELQIEAHSFGKQRDRTFGHELMEVIKANYELSTSEDDMSRIANGWLEFLWQAGIELDWSDIQSP